MIETHCLSKCLKWSITETVGTVPPRSISICFIVSRYWIFNSARGPCLSLCGFRASDSRPCWIERSATPHHVRLVAFAEGVPVPKHQNTPYTIEQWIFTTFALTFVRLRGCEVSRTDDVSHLSNLGERRRLEARGLLRPTLHNCCQKPQVTCVNDAFDESRRNSHDSRRKRCAHQNF